MSAVEAIHGGRELTSGTKRHSDNQTRTTEVEEETQNTVMERCAGTGY